MSISARSALLGAAVLAPLVKYLRSEPDQIGPEARRNAPGDFVQLGHGITHVVTGGPESGDPVLFIPGATLSLWMWDGLFEELAESGFRTIRYDRYGIGFSDRPDVEYGQDLFETQIVDLLDELGVDRPVTLVALAFGCPIAAEFALRHPDRVAGVCLIAPDGFATPLNLGLRLAMLPVVGDAFFQIVGDRALKARVPGYSDDPRIVSWVMARFSAELRYRGFKRSLISAVRNLPIHGGEHLYRFLNTRDIPLQLIWGREDRVTPMPSEETVQEVFSTADLRLLDGVGHLPHREQLGTVTKIIREFLTRISLEKKAS